MSALLETSPGRLRDNPQIDELFRIAKSRHFSESEFERYLALLPNYAAQVDAAKEIIAHEQAVVTETIKQVFFLYPFSKHHEFSKVKCIQDVSYVSVYATHSMLIDEPGWFRDKFLLWLKTILQAFSFPAREERVGADPKTIPPYPEITAYADTLPKRRRAIYETYSRLLKNYQNVLSPQAFSLIEPHLQLAVDILASE